MQNSSARRHPRSGNDDSRPSKIVQRPGSASSLNETKIPSRKRISMDVLQSLHIDVVLFAMSVVEPCRFGAHRRINCDRQNRNLALVLEFAQVIDEKLSAPNRECWDHDLSAALGGL